MTEERKTLLIETTELLKDLDQKSLELIRTGAELLRAPQRPAENPAGHHTQTTDINPDRWNYKHKNSH